MVHQFAMTNQMITTKNHGNLPIYQQITEQISREISAGLLIDGERLPTERDMAKRYGVAVRTLRKSLAQLTQMGLLIRRQGSGNYIRKNENHDSIYSFFRLELPSGGGLPSAQIISMDTIAKPADLPAFGEADFGHRFRRLRFLDEVPAAVEEIWLDGSVAAKTNSDYGSHGQKIGSVWTQYQTGGHHPPSACRQAQWQDMSNASAGRRPISRLNIHEIGLIQKRSAMWHV